jgi:hypothetical protein
MGVHQKLRAILLTSTSRLMEVTRRQRRLWTNRVRRVTVPLLHGGPLWFQDISLVKGYWGWGLTMLLRLWGEFF